MIIEEYDFGRMKIDGKIFTKDLIILPNRIIENWWREEGHLLKLSDIFEVFEIKPEFLIIGQGAYGLMKISEEVIDKLNEYKIKYYTSNTFEAVKKFNELNIQKKVGVFHLTC